MSIQRLPDSELVVMKTLWSTADAITSAEICEKLQENKKWKATTVLTLLSRLVEKKFVGYQRSGRSYLYFALVKEQEYLKNETGAFFDLLHGGSLKSLLASLYDARGIGLEDIEDLKRWLSEKENCDD